MRSGVPLGEASAAMRFGLAGTLGGMESAGPACLLELAQLAEALGFDCMWFQEEHFRRTRSDDPRVILSPVVGAAAVAPDRLRIGFSVLLVPLHNPLRLAEEIGTLDVLSGGRVNLGVSRANGVRYNIPFGYDQESGPTLAECLDAMIGYWQGEPISVEGIDYTVSPLPVQQPYPPVFVGAYRSESLRWAAERGYPTIQHGIQSPASLERCLTTYAASGGDVSKVPVGRFCYVDESDAAARSQAWEVVAGLAKRLHRIGLSRRGDDLIISEADLEPERFYHETAIVGGPESVAARIKHLRDDYGVAYVNVLSSFMGLMPQHLLRRSLELFAHEVMPLIDAPTDTAAADTAAREFATATATSNRSKKRTRV